uniref:Calcium channel flower n=1 Tax=Arion vulgaris TaxID=1028688 RepID=A0A0B6ZI39_9EUPU
MGQKQTTSSLSSLQAGAESNQTGAQSQQVDDGVSWWCKSLARTCCVVAGLTAMITGLFRMITFTPLCFVAGLLLMFMGFFEILLEAPCCCQFLDFIQPISRFSERRSYWQKALVYGLPPLLPLLLCFSITTIIGCVVLIASGVIYGLIALGKKADRSTMMARAQGRDTEMDDTLVTNEISPSPYSSNQ